MKNLVYTNVGLPPRTPPPETSPHPPVAASPAQLSLNTSLKQNHHPHNLPVFLGIGIAVIALAITMLVVLVVLIRRKSRELEDSDANDDLPPKAIALSARKFQDGMFLFLAKAPHFGNIYFPLCG